jgi:hypothetical protein
MARAQGIVAIVWHPNLRSVPPEQLIVPSMTWLRARLAEDIPGSPVGPDGRAHYDISGQRVLWFRTIRDVVLPQGLMATVGVEAMADGQDHNIASRVPLAFDSGVLAALNQEIDVASFGPFHGGTDVSSGPQTVPIDGSVERFAPGAGSPQTQSQIAQIQHLMRRSMERDRIIREQQGANRATVTVNQGTDWIVNQGDQPIVWFDQNNEVGEKEIIHTPEMVMRPPTLKEIWID